MNFVRTVVYYLLYPFCRLFFFLCHPVYHVRGRENIPDGPYILCCNHSNGSDPFWILFAVRPKKVFRFLAKAEFAKVPVLSAVMRSFGVVFVDRGNHDVAAVDQARRELQNGDQLMIFPEGTRVRPGQHALAKCGAIQLSHLCNVPVLPMYLTQDKKLLRPLTAIIGKAYYPIPMEESKSRAEMKVLATELVEKIYRMGEPVCK